MAKTSNDPSEKNTVSFLLLIAISSIKNFVKPLVINPKSSCSPICLSLTYFSWDDQKSPSSTFPSPKYPIQCRGVHAQHIQYQNPTGNDFDHILRSKKYLYALVSFFAIHFAVSPLIWFYTLQGYMKVHKSNFTWAKKSKTRLCAQVFDLFSAILSPVFRLQ